METELETAVAELVRHPEGWLSLSKEERTRIKLLASAEQWEKGGSLKRAAGV